MHDSLQSNIFEVCNIQHCRLVNTDYVFAYIYAETLIHECMYAGLETGGNVRGRSPGVNFKGGGTKFQLKLNIIF